MKQWYERFLKRWSRLLHWLVNNMSLIKSSEVSWKCKWNCMVIHEQWLGMMSCEGVEKLFFPVVLICKVTIYHFWRSLLIFVFPNEVRTINLFIHNYPHRRLLFGGEIIFWPGQITLISFPMGQNVTSIAILEPMVREETL